jgi:hypothetical protein
MNTANYFDEHHQNILRREREMKKSELKAIIRECIEESFLVDELESIDEENPLTRIRNKENAPSWRAHKGIATKFIPKKKEVIWNPKVQKNIKSDGSHNP